MVKAKKPSRMAMWYTCLRWLTKRHIYTSSSSCANRFTGVFCDGDMEYTIIARDTRLPDGYERTELLRLLELIRLHEARQMWSCPEPWDTYDQLPKNVAETVDPTAWNRMGALQQRNLLAEKLEAMLIKFGRG